VQVCPGSWHRPPAFFYGHNTTLAIFSTSTFLPFPSLVPYTYRMPAFPTWSGCQRSTLPAKNFVMLFMVCPCFSLF
jgi:hypothetical protein